MGKSLHIKTLASAISVALLGVSFQAPAAAEAPRSIQAQVHQSYIVKFAETGLLNYAGGVTGFAPTTPARSGSRKLDTNSPAAQAYSQYLQVQRGVHMQAIAQALGTSVSATHNYGITMNGVAMDLTPSQAMKLTKLPGVVSIKPAGTYKLDTYRGPTFIGADTIWDGSATPTGVGTRGEGIVVADLDTGAFAAHPSFANDPTCGFSPANPKLVGAFDCSSTDGAGACNGPDPEAAPGNGHGVHTASTVLGNTLDNTAVPPPALPNGVSMSGVAPCAALISYKVCQTDTCGGADIAAGIENAIAEGVDALNFSISGGTSPWSDFDRDFLDAVGADVFISASAGNTRAATPDPVGQVNHRGPWVMTVAASTQDQIIGPNLSLTGPDVPPVETTGIPLNPGNTTTSTPELTNNSIETYPTNVEGCTASGGIAPGTFTGSIALLSRGTCAFTEKITNATNAGADMVVIYNNVAGTINMDTTGSPPTPAYSITQAEGAALTTFIDAHPTDSTADVTAIAVGASQGDVLAGFSFRGPTPAPLADLTKPDITAPGVNIYAAVTAAEGNYGFYSGTSMSAPHVTGSAALVRDVHPAWTVSEVKSALQTTAFQGGFQEDGTTSWNTDDVGSGRVDLTKAALAGLTLDETIANYLAADPNGGSIDVKELNLASMRNVDCPDTGCTWTRTVTNRLAASATWDVTTNSTAFNMSVSPTNFTLAPGASQAVTVTATPILGNNDLAFGTVDFAESLGASPDQHLTVAIQRGVPAPDIDVTPTSLAASQPADQTSSQNLAIGNLGGVDLNFTLDNGTIPVELAAQGTDPGGNGIASDVSAADGVGVYSADDFSVGGDASVTKLFVDGFVQTGTLDTVATAIDFYIYADAAGVPAGNPEDGANSYLWTFSAAPTAAGVDITDDHIELDLAAAGAPALDLPAGTYWIIVAPNVASLDNATRWNWFASDGNNSGSDALLIDPGNLFGAGATDWTSIAALTANGVFAGLSYIVSGEAACGASWLSVTPTSGVVLGAGSIDLAVTFDSTALAQGTYTSNICIASDDPDEALVVVPVSLEVTTSSDNIFQNGFDGTGGGGDIVDSGVVNIAVPEDISGVYINWLTGDTCFDQSCAPTFNAYSTGIGLHFFWPNSGGGNEGGVGNATTFQYDILAPGATIGPASEFIANAGDADMTNWVASDEGYLGFKFDCAAPGGVCYGYVEIDTTAGTGFPATVVEYWYNSAGDAITIIP